MSVRSIRLRLLLTALAEVLFWIGAAPTASAQFYTWNAPNTGVWSSGANWNVGTAPPSAPATELTFTATGASSYTATNDIANPFLLRRLAFDNLSTGMITIAPAAGGGAITFAGTAPELDNFGSGAVVLSMPLNLAADTLFTGQGPGPVTLSGTVNDGGGGFGLNTAMASTYAFTASGASSINFLRVFSGTTQITAGTWTLTNATTADATAAFIVGKSSGQTAAFTLSGGATLTVPGGNVLFGEVAGSTGTGTISGAGTTVTAASTATDTGLFVVGNSGTGSLTISGEAVANSRLGVIGRLAGSNGTVVVDGAGSRWTTTSTLTVGGSGTGSLTVQGGGQVSPGELILVGNAGGAATVLVTGTGSQIVTTASGSIGTRLGSTLTVADGGLVSGHFVAIGQTTGTASTAVIDSGTLTVRDGLVVGHGGVGGLIVRNGGVVTVAGNSAFAGTTSTSVGTITVTGTNSRLTMLGTNSFLIFGGGSGAGRGDLIVENGGTVSAVLQLTFAQDTGSSSVSVVDAGSVTVTGTISLGQGGTASLTVRNGGTATAGNVAVGTNTGAAGTLTVTGAGSTLSTTGFIRLAGFGTTPGGSGTLTVSAGGSASADGLLTLFGGGTANVDAGSLAVGGLKHGTATSIGNVNLSNGGALTITDGLGATYAGVIGGAGSVTKAGAGTQTLTGVNTYTGNTNVNAGALVLSGAGSISTSSVITVANGATLDVGGVTGGFTLTSGQALRGSGTVTGAVTAGSGSVVAPGTSAGTDDLVINGNLTLGSGSVLAARLNGNVAGTTYDQVAVTGTGAITLTGSTLTLTGTYSPLATDVLTIVRNGPNTAVTGAFANPAVPGDPLGRLDLGGYYGNISYFGSGGTISGGNDVVVYDLVPVPEPGTILAVATAAGLAAAGPRRRLTRHLTAAPGTTSSNASRVRRSVRLMRRWVRRMCRPRWG